MDISTMIIDDQSDVRLLIRVVLEAANEGLFVIGEAASGREALDRIDDDDPLVVILDEMMPDMNGIETLGLIRERRPTQIVILCSAFLDTDIVERARAAGVYACASKDDVRRLPDLIRRAVGA